MFFLCTLMQGNGHESFNPGCLFNIANWHSFLGVESNVTGQNIPTEVENKLLTFSSFTKVSKGNTRLMGHS